MSEDNLFLIHKMVFGFTASLISALFFSRLVQADPVHPTVFDDIDGKARDILERSTPVAPHWVIYSDTGTRTMGPPDVSDIDVRNFARGCGISLSNLLVCFRDSPYCKAYYGLSSCIS